jgi:hypothetical protein
MTFHFWRYHATEAPRLIENEQQYKALGPGWADTPAAFGIETAPGKEADPTIAQNLPGAAKPKGAKK